MTPTYCAKVAPDGRLAVRCDALAGKLVVIRERQARRSQSQNARYWGMLTVAAKELGYDDVDELHEGCAMKFLAQRELAPGLLRRKRTPKLTTAEFCAYADAVERFFRIDLGVDLSEWDAMELPA